MFNAKIVIRSKAPPANILNIPSKPSEFCANNSATTVGSIPGNGTKVPTLKTIKAKTVNHNLFFNSSALPKADISTFAAIFSANETIIVILTFIYKQNYKRANSPF